MKRGAQEMVQILDPLVGFWVAKACACCPGPHAPLVAHTLPGFHRKFQELVSAAGLSDLQLRPYGLRRGGATAHFALHGRIEDTVFRGRWNSSSTARIYITEGAAVLALAKLSAARQLHVQQLVAEFARTTRALGIPMSA